MIRLSDARMSGTAFGTIILHITPEAWIGGPLAMVQNGDRIRLGTKQRQLALLVDEFTLAARHKAWIPPPAHPNSARGYKKLYLDTVLQADEGCDFAFMVPPSSYSAEQDEE